jgi:hypothetical protein
MHRYLTLGGHIPHTNCAIVARADNAAPSLSANHAVNVVLMPFKNCSGREIYRAFCRPVSILKDRSPHPELAVNAQNNRMWNTCDATTRLTVLSPPALKIKSLPPHARSQMCPLCPTKRCAGVKYFGQATWRGLEARDRGDLARRSSAPKRHTST